MAQSPDLKFRVWALIIIFIFITTMYTLEGVFIAGKNNYESALDENTTTIEEAFLEEGITHPENYTYEDVDTKLNPLDIVFGFFGFMAFAPLELPPALQSILVGAVTICFLTLGLLIYAIIRDWIPFV